jgi:hypothetical protein
MHNASNTRRCANCFWSSDCNSRANYRTFFYALHPNFTPADGLDSLDSGVAKGDLLATLFPAYKHRIDQAWQVTHAGRYLEITPASNAG